MLALMNPKIVAELNNLAASWTAVASDMNASASAKPPRARKRKAKPKS